MEQIISNVDEFVPIIISAFISLFSTSWIQPYILKVAVTKNIVDKPNARKLQQATDPQLSKRFSDFHVPGTKNHRAI